MTLDFGLKATVADRAILSQWVLDKEEINDAVNSPIVGLSASISTESIIPGAELKLAWEDADDVFAVYDYDKNTDNTNLGKITASCKIAF